MKVQVYLEDHECCDHAEDQLRKALNEKVTPQKKPHPDKLIEELTQKFNKEYEKNMLEMMKEIFSIIKQ